MGESCPMEAHYFIFKMGAKMSQFQRIKRTASTIQIMIENSRKDNWARTTCSQGVLVELFAVAHPPRKQFLEQRLVILFEASLLVDLADLINVIRGTQEHRHALVYFRRHNLHDTLTTSGALAASLLKKEAHGRALVEQAQLAIWVLGVARVPEKAAVEKRAMNVSYHGPYVTRRVLLAA